jgi:hypothetical protein
MAPRSWARYFQRLRYRAMARIIQNHPVNMTNAWCRLTARRPRARLDSSRSCMAAGTVWVRVGVSTVRKLSMICHHW